MTPRETLAVMDVLTVSYPKLAVSGFDVKKTARLWAEMFAEDYVFIVMAAVKALIATKTDDWPPSPGAVKAHIRKIMAPGERTELDAWLMVSNAVRKTDWNHPEIQYNKLPTDVQAAIGSPRALVEWGRVGDKELSTVIASNFMRSYTARKKHQREYDALPTSAKKMIEQNMERMRLESEQTKAKVFPPANQSEPAPKRLTSKEALAKIRAIQNSLGAPEKTRYTEETGEVCGTQHDADIEIYYRLIMGKRGLVAHSNEMAVIFGEVERMKANGETWQAVKSYLQEQSE